MLSWYIFSKQDYEGARLSDILLFKRTKRDHRGAGLSVIFFKRTRNINERKHFKLYQCYEIEDCVVFHLNKAH